MDKQCHECGLVCKRLDPEDEPVRYSFQHLTPEQAIAQIASDISRYSSWHHLKVEQSECSTGNQLAVLLSVEYRSDDQTQYLQFIAQAERVDQGPTEVYFRYGIPESCCHQPVVKGFSTMVTEILQSLSQTDWLLEEGASKNRQRYELSQSPKR